MTRIFEDDLRTGFGTRAIHAGQRPDPTSGAIMTPIYQTSTYVQDALGQHKGYEYARGKNPTREALERNVAALEGGRHGFAFGSGMGCLDSIMKLCRAGDHVVCESADSQLEVNGVALDEPYINPATTACKGAFDVTVPEGKVWVMGDNRHASADSAYHEIQGEDGFVPLDDVTGTAEVVFWPASRWTGLNDGHDAFADVPDQP